MDSNFDFNTRLDSNGGDLLDDFRRRVKINQSLVDVHSVSIPSLGSITIRSFTRSNSQMLGRQSDRSLNLQPTVNNKNLLFVLGSRNQIAANFFQVLNVSGCQGDSDAVHRWFDKLFLVLLLWSDVRHFYYYVTGKRKKS